MSSFRQEGKGEREKGGNFREKKKEKKESISNREKNLKTGETYPFTFLSAKSTINWRRRIVKLHQINKHTHTKRDNWAFFFQIRIKAKVLS